MLTTDTATNIITLLPILFDRIGDSHRFYQEFDDMRDARRFAEEMRSQHGDLLSVEQRNTRVIMSDPYAPHDIDCSSRDGLFCDCGQWGDDD